jgi:hypothetical protein
MEKPKFWTTAQNLHRAPATRDNLGLSGLGEIAAVALETVSGRSTIEQWPGFRALVDGWGWMTVGRL